MLKSSLLRISMGLIGTLALGFVFVQCGGDKSAAAPTHPFKITAEEAVPGAKITIHNKTDLTVALSFAGAQRAGKSLAPGESWTQVLTAGTYAYSAKAQGLDKSGSLDFTAKTHYVWTVTN